MDDPRLFDTLCSLIKTVAKLEPETTIVPQSALVDDLGVDSLDLVSIYLEVQDTFGVVVNEEDLANLVTVADLMAYVKERRASQAA